MALLTGVLGAETVFVDGPSRTSCYKARLRETRPHRQLSLNSPQNRRARQSGTQLKNVEGGTGLYLGGRTRRLPPSVRALSTFSRYPGENSKD